MSNQPRRRGPMGGGHGRMGTGEKAKDFKGTMKKLFTYLSEYKIGIFFVMIFAIGSTVFNIIGPKVLGKATTEIFKGLVGKVSGGSGIDFTKIGKILLTLLCLYVISACFSFIQGYIMTGVSQKLTYRMRKEISEKINRMPMNYFDTTTHGEVLSRVTNDVDTLSQSLNQSATQMITSVTTIIGVLIMMISISPLMTVIALLILPVSMVLISVIVKHSQKYFKSQQEYLGHINGQVEETYGGHLVVKSFNKEKDMVKQFDETNNVLYKSAWKSQFFSGMMQPIMAFVGNLGYAGVALSGGFLAIKGTITIGDIQAFIQYVKNFSQPITQIAQVINQVQSMAAASERVFEFLGEEEEDQFAANPVKLDTIRGEVEFRHVHFGYREDQTIINDFSAKVKPGQKIAIVGPTGAGKTTIVKLLMRFYDVGSGEILVDGHNVKDFNRRDLREAFGMVLQDTWLFNGTIEENIKYGNFNASKEDVILAAKIANVHHFIKTLPEGYDMVLNEEASNISQGEKQLLTIARAILSDPAILILDEATSALDPETEVSVLKSVKSLPHKPTCIIITHRPSALNICHRIIRLEKGHLKQVSKESILEVATELV